MWILIFSSFALFLFLIYKLGTNNFFLNKIYNIPGLYPIPFLGNLLHVVKYGSHGFDRLSTERFGPTYSFYSGRYPVIMTTDPQLMEDILIRKSKYFIDRMDFYGVGKLMQLSLLRLKGKQWERMRSVVSPAFTPSKLRHMMPMMKDSVGHVSYNYLGNEGGSQSVDIKRLFSEITMAIIVKTTLGINIDEETSLRSEFLHHSQSLLTIPIKNIWFIILNILPESSRFIDWLHPYGIVANGSILFFINQIKKRMNKLKMNNPIEDQSFLSMMMKRNIQRPDSVLSQDEIMAQCILLVLAGYETSSSTLTLLSHLLSVNIEEQREIQRDIAESIPDMNDISYEDIQKCTLLDNAIFETLRMYPPISKIFRQCTDDTDLSTSSGGTMKVKSGTTFGIPIHVVHLDESLWSAPLKFDIDRFESLASRSCLKYLPFGMGPRNCLGKSVALMELRLVMIMSLSKYTFLSNGHARKDILFESDGLSLLKTADEPLRIDFLRRD